MLRLIAKNSGLNKMRSLTPNFCSRLDDLKRRMVALRKDLRSFKRVQKDKLSFVGNLILSPKLKILYIPVLMGGLLVGCSGESFHLRGSVALPEVYQQVYLQSDLLDSPFEKVLRKQLAAVGSTLVADPDKATAIIRLDQYQEGKRVAGYGSNREVRQYLIFLRFDFSTKSSEDGRMLIPVSKINLDKIQIYDSAFVLGKIEEERLIKEDLRESAARQVLLRLQHGINKN